MGRLDIITKLIADELEAEKESFEIRLRRIESESIREARREDTYFWLDFLKKHGLVSLWRKALVTRYILLED